MCVSKPSSSVQRIRQRFCEIHKGDAFNILVLIARCLLSGRGVCNCRRFPPKEGRICNLPGRLFENVLPLIFWKQLSSCPEKTRALCRTVQTTVWGAVVSSLNAALGSSGGGGAVTSSADSSGGSGVSGPGPGGGASVSRLASIMGAVSSRHISTSDVLVEEGGHGTGGGHNHDHGNGHYSHKNGITTASGGFLQKQDLHYDIGSSSQYHHVRQPSVRSRSQQPMPTTDELDRRFAKVLSSLTESQESGVISTDLCITTYGKYGRLR
ncbi:unnamed protein product [Ceratitis capitata]|uniref:(Mediterranean fruit fly) hypothetical protein n=1 Tax=Ceratitis capitata TaxID=7213 RepID=A0A811UX74_CERCA|nr:unnamed protein product [Ceratitis capitata]